MRQHKVLSKTRPRVTSAETPRALRYNRRKHPVLDVKSCLYVTVEGSARARDDWDWMVRSSLPCDRSGEVCAPTMLSVCLIMITGGKTNTTTESCARPLNTCHTFCFKDPLKHTFSCLLSALNQWAACFSWLRDSSVCSNLSGKYCLITLTLHERVCNFLWRESKKTPIF